MDITNYDETRDVTVGAWNPDTGTYDYDPNDLPDTDDDKVGFKTVGVARIGIELRLPSGEILVVNPEDYIENMTIENPDHTVRTISGRLRTVCGSSRFQRFMPRFYNPRGPQLSDYILPMMLVIDCSEAHRSVLEYVPIRSILSIGGVLSAETIGAIIVGPGSQYASLDTVVENAPAGSVIELLSGDYDVDLNIGKSLSIIAKGSATLHGNVVIEAKNEDDQVDVKLIGLDLTDRAKIAVNNVNSLTVDNCLFSNLDFGNEVKPVVINIVEGERIFVKITNNTFQMTEKNIPWNIIRIFPKLSEMSVINNNRFERDSCESNTIELYGLERNGDVEVSHNYCEQSRNMLHIGFRGTVNGRIAVVDNTYDSTTQDATYAGLVCVEPYYHETIDMHMLDISISGTKNFSSIEQLVYIYSSSEDVILEDHQLPKIYIDGYFKPVPYIKETESNG